MKSYAADCALGSAAPFPCGRAVRALGRLVPGARRLYGLTGVPETYHIDAHGRIAGHAVGAVSRAELERDIAPLLRERP